MSSPEEQSDPTPPTLIPQAPPELSTIGLRVLIEVAKHGSFTAAAEALTYTQSAVSRQVNSLERAVGLPLFDRVARGVHLTPAGEVLLRHATKALAQIGAAELELEGLRDRLAGRLAVGAYPLAAAAVVPRGLSAIAQRHPGLDLVLREASSPAQLRMLRGGGIEVAVIAARVDVPEVDLSEFRVHALSSGGRGLGVVLPAAHPLAASEVLDVQDLETTPWIVGEGHRDEPQFGAWPTLEKPIRAYSAQGWTTRLGLVAAGLGLCVLPGFAVDILPSGVVWRAVSDPALIERRATLVLTQPNASKAATAMAQELLAAFGNVHR